MSCKSTSTSTSKSTCNPTSESTNKSISEQISRPTCNMAELCGGCIYQGVPYEEQLAEKDKLYRRLLAKYDIDESVYEGMKPAFAPYEYRNKMEYTFGDLVKDGRLELGMHKKGHFMSIITTDECQLVPDDFNKILSATVEFCRERGYSFYHKKTHIGLLRNLIVRCGVRTDELLINIVTSSSDRSGDSLGDGSSDGSGNVCSDNFCNRFDEEAYVERLKNLELDKNIVGIIRTYNDSVADAVINEGTKILYGRDYYYEEILGLRFKVNAFAFFQTNIEAIERLYSEALELVPDINSKTVYDLYCGTGTISQLMASKARKVYGVEIVESAVVAARENALLNGFDNCEFICGDVRKVLSDMKEAPEVIVVDPPRVGLHDKVIGMLCGYGMEEFVYISCNPKTLCMNLESLAQYGYKPVCIRAYDNFPMTKHVESICLLRLSRD